MASYNNIRLGHYTPSEFKQGSNTVDAMYLGNKLVYEKVTTAYSATGYPNGVDEQPISTAGNKFAGILVDNETKTIGLKVGPVVAYDSSNGRYTATFYATGNVVGYFVFGRGFSVSDISVTGSDMTAEIVDPSEVTPIAAKLANFPTTAAQPQYYSTILESAQRNLRGLTVVKITSTHYTWQQNLVFSCTLTKV